jgi:MATE family multidrug resistance protein
MRLLRFGLPNGFRFALELLAWTAFLSYIGRLGTPELAASNLAFRINTIAFFPALGLSIAVATLVGHAQGAGRPDLAEKSTYRGMVLTELWMVLSAAIFVLFARQLFGVFLRETELNPAQRAQT